MKRIVIVTAILALAAPLVFAELSPNRQNVKYSEVPRECLENGSATKGNMKYTCAKVDSSEVWNDQELRTYMKDIFEATKVPIEQNPVRVGLVVRQDSAYTTTQTVTQEDRKVAVVEKRDKYRYARK